jgi:hypothetical protein
MPAKKTTNPRVEPVSVDEIRKIALSFPGVTEGRSYGTTGFHVGAHLIARMKEEGDVLVVRVQEGHRDILVSIDSTTYFFTEHYRDYPMVLVRLNRIGLEALTDLIEQAWKCVAPKKVIRAFEVRE